MAVLIGFIGASLENVRLELVAKARKARESEVARKLAQESDRIADILNADFRDQRMKITGVRAISSRSGSAHAAFGGLQLGEDRPDLWTSGEGEPGDVDPNSGPSLGGGEAAGRPDPKILKTAAPRSEGEDTVRPVGGNAGSSRRPRGGFKVAYQHLGTALDRSVYDANAMTILINLDHIVVAAALGLGGTEDVAFRRLSYEIAFSEYAFALAHEAVRIDPGLPVEDLLFDVRSTLQRVSRVAVDLYRS